MNPSRLFWSGVSYTVLALAPRDRPDDYDYKPLIAGVVAVWILFLTVIASTLFALFVAMLSHWMNQ